MRFSLSILAFSLLAACSSPTKGPAPETQALPQDAKQSAPKPVEQAVAAAATSVKSECANKSDVRILELRTKGKGCEVAYTKNGQEAVVASSINGTVHCENTINKIKERLKGSGFECK